MSHDGDTNSAPGQSSFFYIVYLVILYELHVHKPTLIWCRSFHDRLGIAYKPYTRYTGLIRAVFQQEN